MFEIGVSGPDRLSYPSALVPNYGVEFTLVVRNVKGVVKVKIRE